MRPKKTILCVDGDVYALSVLTFLLETHGFRVFNAATAGAALELLAVTAQGTLDLLVCDLSLPGMGGNELVREAKLLHPELRTLIVSKLPGIEDRLGLYADPVLLGKCEPRVLLETVQVLVARKRGPKKAVAAIQVQGQVTGRLEQGAA